MNTKAILTAFAISAAAATTVWAEAHFAFGDYLAPSSTLEFGMINTDSDGVLEVYDFIAGEQGDLIGSQTLHAGANPDVRVNVGHTPQQDVLAIVKVDGHAVSVKHFHVHERE